MTYVRVASLALAIACFALASTPKGTKHWDRLTTIGLALATLAALLGLTTAGAR
jgi:hypothetical protein